ncbi:MAG: hypothetical protein P8L85_07180 [Rubripirellula sp.]|nr:hypothetical protein [Rubripirellula sp.]
MNQLKTCLFVSLFLFPAVPTRAGEPPANSILALQDSFDRTELGDGWSSAKGTWRIADGVLRGSEVPEEKHAAAIRRVVESENAVYELKFRLTDQAKAFHLGFDPAPGELEKRGHLFSVIITPSSWKIQKHLDKNRREEDPNETLAQAETTFQLGKWYTLRVGTWGSYVTARIDGKGPLKASHPTFAVKKPTLVFRCSGDGIEIDDIHVWTQR